MTKPANNENISVPPQKHHLETVSDKLLAVGVRVGEAGGFNRFYVATFLALDSAVAHKHKINPKLHSKHIKHLDVPFFAKTATD